MLAKSREAHSGVQLEVNERILDSCDSLMMVSLSLSLSSGGKFVSLSCSSLVTHQFYNPTLMTVSLKKQIISCQKYSTESTILFHQNSFQIYAVIMCCFIV